MGDDRLRLFIETVDRASAGMASIGRTLGGLAAAYISFQTAQRVIQGAINQIGEAAAAAAEQEQADIKLAQALRSVGDSSKATFDALTEHATALQRTTNFTDEQIQSAQGLLISLGKLTGEGLERATAAALDLAAGLGVDLNAATLLIAKAAAGNTAALSRYGIVLDESLPKSEKFAAVLDFIADRFGGRAAAAADSFSGRIEQVKKQFGELQEALGKHIIASPEFTALLESTATALTEMGKRVADPAFTKGIGDMVVGFVNLGLAMARLLELAGSSSILFDPLNLVGARTAAAAATEARIALEGIATAVRQAHAAAQLGPILGPELPPLAPLKEINTELSALAKHFKELSTLTEDEEVFARVFENAQQWADTLTTDVTLFADAWFRMRGEVIASGEEIERLLGGMGNEILPLDNIEAFNREFEKLNGLQQNMVNLAAQFGAELATAALQGEIKLGQMLRKIIAALIAAVIQAAVLAAIVVAVSGGTIKFGTAFRGALGVAGSVAPKGSSTSTTSAPLSGIPTIGGGTPVAPGLSAPSIAINVLGTDPSFINAVQDAITQQARQYGYTVGVEVVGG